MPTDPLLPVTPTVTVHGDSHMGNIMRDTDERLRLIDFDMTARGPAGSEFGFIVLMLGVLTVVGTLLSDILLAVVDPRIKFTGR